MDWVIIASLLSFIPGMHPNTYCSLFYHSELIGYVVGFTMIMSVLGIVLFSTSSDSTVGPFVYQLFRQDRGYVYQYLLFMLIGMGFGVLIGDLYEIVQQLKNYRYFIYSIVIFIIIYILIRKNIKFTLGFLISGLWGLMVIDERYMFHIFAGMFGLVYLFNSLIDNDNNTGSAKLKSTNIDINIDSILYMVLGIVVGYFSLIFPGISSPSIFGSLFIAIPNPSQYIYYYSTLIGFQSTASIYYYYYTGNIRNGYVTCINSTEKLLQMFIGIILGTSVLFMIVKYLGSITIPKFIYLIVVFIILGYSYISEGMFGVFITFGSAIVSYINQVSLRAGADANMGVIAIPTLYLIIRFFIQY
ncbi:MAG: hypothetical protein QW785_01155 [Candidatus Anstonellales archaeon]